MGAATATGWPIWGIAAVATAGVIARPFSWPEFVWAVAGALLLVLLGLVPIDTALTGVARGTDVYLFLTGMMLLSELARQEGLFDWLAAKATRSARGSARRLFTLMFGVGIVVTTFLSNDATAVVLTPAVAAVVRAARVESPLPYLFICAFIANAASFVLPISNPANLVIYGSHMPPLLVWLPHFLLPSIVSIAVTYVALLMTQRTRLHGDVASDISVPALSIGGRLAASGIGTTAVVLIIASALDWQLGLPTCLAGLATALLVLPRSRNTVAETVRSISWGVLPLVAGLFVLVEAMERTGVTQAIATLLHDVAAQSAIVAAWTAGLVLAFGCNLMNNLPGGLVAGRVVAEGHVAESVRAAVLIGVDLGPNLSVTGSLATILWLAALRRDGQHVGALTFLKVGALVMPPALVLALASAFAFG